MKGKSVQTDMAWQAMDVNVARGLGVHRSTTAAEGSAFEEAASFCCDICQCRAFDPAFDAPAFYPDIKCLNGYPVPYAECRDCGTISQFPFVAEARIHQIYEDTAYHRADGAIGRLLDRLMPFYYRVARRIERGRGRRLLDIGAGAGHFLAYARSRGWCVLGTDCSANAQHLAKETYGIRVIDPGHLGQPAPNDFDCVTLFHTLEHVDSPRTVLRQVRRLLTADGQCIVQIPVLDSWEYAIWGRHSAFVGAPQHRHLFTTRSMAKLAGVCGLRLERVKNEWTTPHLFSWTPQIRLSRWFPPFRNQGVRKLACLMAWPAHLPFAFTAARLQRSPFKTFFLRPGRA